MKKLLVVGLMLLLSSIAMGAALPHAQIVIKDSGNASALWAKLNSKDKGTFGNGLINYFNGLMGGANRAIVYYTDGNESTLHTYTYGKTN